MADGVWVVATITLAGLPVGREEFVDPDDPYIATCLEYGYLQRVPTQGDVPIAPEPEPEPVVETEAVADPDPAPE